MVMSGNRHELSYGAAVAEHRFGTEGAVRTRLTNPTGLMCGLGVPSRSSPKGHARAPSGLLPGTGGKKNSGLAGTAYSAVLVVTRGTVTLLSGGSKEP